MSTLRTITHYSKVHFNIIPAESYTLVKNNLVCYGKHKIMNSPDWLCRFRCGDSITDPLSLNHASICCKKLAHTKSLRVL